MKEEHSKLADKFMEQMQDVSLIRIRGEMIPLLVMTTWLRYFDSRNKLNHLYPIIVVRTKEGVKGYMNDTAYSNLAKEMLLAHLNNKWSLDKSKDDYYNIKKKIVKEYGDYFDGKYSAYSEKEKLLLLEEFYQDLITICKYTLYIERLDETLARQAVVESKKPINFDKFWKISELLDFVSFDINNAIYSLDLIRRKDNIMKLQYAYSTYNFVPNKRWLEEKIKALDIKTLEEEIKLKQANAQANHKIKIEKIKTLSKEEKILLDFLEYVIFCRDDRKETIQKVLMLLYDVSEELLVSWGIDSKLVGEYFIKDILQGKEYCVNLLGTIKKRQEGYVVLLQEDENFLEENELIEETEYFMDNIFSSQNEKSTEIKGQVGCKGYYKGRARIIIKREEFSSFKKGEVLVTGMTRPEFVPLMKLAGAIVTDEGGITSHAAIVSRELNKPCIIGTKTSTKTLKTGDLVELRLNHGIVKILDRKN